MRVRESDGVKLVSELREKGSAVIDTVSSATALVDVDETVNKEGEIAGAANDLEAVAPIKTSEQANPVKATTLRKANARILIFSRPSIDNLTAWFESEVRSNLESLVEGPPGHAPCVQKTIACGAGARSTTLLDVQPVNLGEKSAD